jgi:hypothetical protein
MMVEARFKPLEGAGWSCSCGHAIGSGAFCPGRVAIVERLGARAPIHHWLHKVDGEWFCERKHRPNRTTPDPELRGHPRRSGPHNPAEGLALGPSSQMIPIPAIIRCSRGHRNLVTVPPSVV